MPSRRETINTLRPRQDGRHFVEDIFECIFLNENVWISLNISPKFVPMVRINNFPALVQIMAWRWPGPGDKPLSEPVMVSLVTYICVTRPQWVDQIRESGEQSDTVSVKAENSHDPNFAVANGVVVMTTPESTSGDYAVIMMTLEIQCLQCAKHRYIRRPQIATLSRTCNDIPVCYLSHFCLKAAVSHNYMFKVRPTFFLQS